MADPPENPPDKPKPADAVESTLDKPQSTDQILIYVHLIGTPREAFLVNPNALVEEVRMAFHEKRPNFSQQQFALTFSGLCLHDQDSLSSRGIGAGSVLGCFSRLGVPSPTGQAALAVVRDCLKRGYLSQSRRQTMSDPVESTPDKPKTADPMVIYIQLPDGKTGEILVSPDTTIDLIKHLIYERGYAPPWSQQLWYGDRYLRDDSSTLRSHGISDQFTLRMAYHMLGCRAPNYMFREPIVGDSVERDGDATAEGDVNDK